jgi:hypothetical protein
MNLLFFRNKVIAEALKQKSLILAKQKIPASDRKYARLSGLFLFLFCGFVLIGLLVFFDYVGSYNIFIILFCAVLSLGGLIQLVTGRHFLTKR